MKTLKQFINEMPNSGASTPVKYYKDGNKILPNFGAGRIGKIRPKGGKTIADLIKGV
tara:strand:+ start:120 stop:290 length:171 start_codon:yes stop_codon:yes gene_type:complete